MRPFIVIFILSAINLHLFCQETIEIEFNEATPLWVHTVVDSTFEPIPGQPFFTKYSSLSPISITRDQNHLYIMSSSLEKQSLDDYGFVLDKINIQTGEKIWKHHNTSNNGGQKDIYHTVEIKEGLIEMVGTVEDIDQKYYASHKLLDANSGQLLNYSKSNTTLPNFSTRYFTGFILESDSILLNAYTIGDDVGTINEPVYNYGINVEMYDHKMALLEQTRNLFDFENLGPFSIDQPNFTYRLNETNLISLAYKDRFESWDNLGAKIMWTDISDLQNIKTKQIKDYTDIIPGSKEKFSLHRFGALNNTIHLSHHYPNFDLQKNICYILWLDSMGGIKTFIPVPKYEDHIYQFAQMFYANEHFAYLFTYPSKTDKSGFDVIRIESGRDSVKYVSSITTKNNDEEFGIQINALYVDGYLIFGGFTKKAGFGTKTSAKFYCFKASDLGINFEPVSANDLDSKLSSFKMFPNPASNMLFLKLDQVEQNFVLKIFDINGRMAITECLNENFNQVDISALPKGIYLVKVLKSNGERIGEIEKFVKI